MAKDKLIYASSARKAILKEDPKLAYCIDSIPGVDAVEVVRCKDCKHCIYLSYIAGDVRCGNLHTDYITENSFCSYGERREGE